jgi:hypothetical protein
MNADQGNVLVSEYTAKGLDEKAPKSININGTLGAPHQFLIGKKSLFKDTEIHLLIFKAEGKLTLKMNDDDPYQTHEVTGTLHRDSVLEMFKLNTEHRWTISAIVKFIRTMRYYFADKDDHAKLLDSLQKWSVKVDTVIKQHNDNSGNSLIMLERKVGELDMVKSFNIEVPIFQGYEKKRFKVEIGFDPKNTSVDLFLISDELIELEIGEREKLIDAEVAKFSEYTFSKVVVS